MFKHYFWWLFQCLESLVGVSEEIHTLKEWNEASVRALYALLDIGTFCNLSSSELNTLNATSALLGVIGDDSVGEKIVCWPKLTWGERTFWLWGYACSLCCRALLCLLKMTSPSLAWSPNQAEVLSLAQFRTFVLWRAMRLEP